MPYKNKSRQRAYQRNWIRKRRAQWLKENGPCLKCGSKDDLIAASPDISKPIPHRVWTYSQGRRDRILSGCVVLCKDCYLRHRYPPPPHGTVARYSSRQHPCRCDLCRAARNRSEQARRKRKRKRDRGELVNTWRKGEAEKIRERLRLISPDEIRGIAIQWRLEFKPMILPASLLDQGRELVERVFLAIASQGRDGLSATDVVQESALAPSDASALIDALLRYGLLNRVRSRLIAQRVRGAKSKMRRAIIEFQTLRRKDEYKKEPDGEEPDEEISEEKQEEDEPVWSSDCIRRVVFKLFGADE